MSVYNFINDLTKIESNCKFTTTIRHTNLAHSLDGYLWTVSSLATQKLQIRCLHQTSVVTIEPPLCIIDIGNGCEAFSLTLYIPAESELTTTMQSLTRSQFFLNFNFQYVKMSSFVVFCEMTFAQLTPEELANLQAKIQTLEPMNMKLFNEKLKLIDENYPLTLPLWIILGGQVNSGAFILTEITLKHRKSMSTLFKIGLPLARKIQNDPKTIEHLIQQAGELVTSLVPPEPPPRPLVTATDCPAIVSKPSTNDNTIVLLLTFPHLHHQELTSIPLNSLLKLPRKYMLKDNCVASHMLNTSKKSTFYRKSLLIR